jgi:hypothetical protein
MRNVGFLANGDEQAQGNEIHLPHSFLDAFHRRASFTFPIRKLSQATPSAEYCCLPSRWLARSRDCLQYIRRHRRSALLQPGRQHWHAGFAVWSDREEVSPKASLSLAGKIQPGKGSVYRTNGVAESIACGRRHGDTAWRARRPHNAVPLVKQPE